MNPAAFDFGDAAGGVASEVELPAEVSAFEAVDDLVCLHGPEAMFVGAFGFEVVAKEGKYLVCRFTDQNDRAENAVRGIDR